MKKYQKSNPSIWSGREDSSSNQRIHQIIKCIDLNNDITHPTRKTFGLIGFACDEGVKRNKGRRGANEGPIALRHALSNTPIHGSYDLADFGDITCDDNDLESSQKELGDAIAKLLEANIHPIVIGGGHEVAWGHYQGIDKRFSDKECYIINFDAHFDLRPLLDNQKGSSGTPFLQIATDCHQKNKHFHYACLGIQSTGNTDQLFKKAKELNVQTIFAKDFHLNNGKNVLLLINEIIDQADIIYVTICLDVFATSVAPGVSAPQPLGILPWHIIPSLKKLADSGKVVSLDIAELSPSLDNQNQTASLAASLISHYINSGSEL